MAADPPIQIPNLSARLWVTGSHILYAKQAVVLDSIDKEGKVVKGYHW